MKALAIIVLVLTAIASLAVAESRLPSEAEKAIRRAVSSEAVWRMERKIEGATHSLISTGMVSCATGTGIVWRTLSPLASSIEMTREGMAFEDEDNGRVFKPAAEIRRYRDVVALVDALAEGQSIPDGLFKISADEMPDGEWSIVLEPTSRELRRLLGAVRLEGGSELRRAVMETPSGTTADIRFEEVPVEARR